MSHDDPHYQRYVARMDAAIGRGVAVLLLSSLVAIPSSLILVGVGMYTQGTGLTIVVAVVLLIYGAVASSTASSIVARRVEGSVLRVVFGFDRNLQFQNALMTKGLRVCVHRLRRSPKRQA